MSQPLVVRNPDGTSTVYVLQAKAAHVAATKAPDGNGGWVEVQHQLSEGDLLPADIKPDVLDHLLRTNLARAVTVSPN